MIGMFYDIEDQTSDFLRRNTQAGSNWELAQALQVRPLRPVLLSNWNRRT